jgi:hypothetical protein
MRRAVAGMTGTATSANSKADVRLIRKAVKM